MRELGEYISKDMLQAAIYIPLGIAAGAIGVTVYQLFIKLNQNYSMRKRSMGICFLIIVYITVLLELAFFSREPGSRIGIDLALFETWGTTMRAHSYFIENIAMFIPFGVLFPLGFRMLRRGTFCVAAGFGFSTCLELAQLVTSRGYCQLDDVLTNTLGAWIGWMIFRALWNESSREVF